MFSIVRLPVACSCLNGVAVWDSRCIAFLGNSTLENVPAPVSDFAVWDQDSAATADQLLCGPYYAAVRNTPPASHQIRGVIWYEGRSESPELQAAPPPRGSGPRSLAGSEFAAFLNPRLRKLSINSSPSPSICSIAHGLMKVACPNLSGFQRTSASRPTSGHCLYAMMQRSGATFLS